MNRVSRRSATEAADALLEAGRTQPVLDYDVELGLARHHDWLRGEPPLPEWASAAATTASRSFVAVVVKTFVSTVLIGVLATGAWQARGLLQPSAAESKQAKEAKPSSGASETPKAVVASPPHTQDVAAADAPRPIPIPEQALPSEQPLRRAVHDKRTARASRAHKEPAARAATVASVRSDATEVTSAPLQPAASEPEPAPRNQVAAVVEPKPSTAVPAPRPKPGSQAQGPDDLVEMQQVATAEQLLVRSPGRALALVRQGDQRFARGYFQQERAYIAIMALIRLGRIDEARVSAASFSKQFPAKPYGARIRSALEAHDHAQ